MNSHARAPSLGQWDTIIANGCEWLALHGGVVGQLTCVNRVFRLQYFKLHSSHSIKS